MERQKFMKEFLYDKNSKLGLDKFDEYIAEDLEKAVDRGKKLLGVNDSFVNAFSPIIVTIPAPSAGEVKPLLIYGEDKLRYDLAKFTALFFGEDFFFLYVCIIDHKTGGAFNDKAVEVPYRKIKSIETASKFAYISGVEHHLFEIKLVLDGLEDVLIPLRVIMVDENTPKETYLIPAELFALANDLKTFLREKIKTN